MNSVFEVDFTVIGASKNLPGVIGRTALTPCRSLAPLCAVVNDRSPSTFLGLSIVCLLACSLKSYMQFLMLQHMQSTMRRARPLLSVMLVLSSASNALATDTLSTEWHVSTRGNDSWSGLLAEPTPDGRDGPFRTFERGCIALRRVSQDAAGRTPRQVIVHAGTYRLPGGLTLDDSVSGTNGAPTIFRSAGDGEVVLTSGAVLFSRALSKVTNKATLDRLPPQARSEVVQLDGSTLGFAAWPNRITSLPPGSELFIDGQRMRIAQWPNSGWGFISEFVDTGAEDTTGAQFGRGATFKVTGEQPNNWDAESGAWLLGFWRWDWSAEIIKIASIDTKRQSITLAAPTTYGVRQGNPTTRRYRALNVLAELDQPGEYWVDPHSLNVVFWPPKLANDSLIVVSASPAPIVSIKGARYLKICGLTIDATQSSCVEVRGGNNVEIVECEIRNAREFGVRIEGGSRHSVQGCNVHATGGGGIQVIGGNRKELLPCDHRVTNCHIWQFSELKMTFAHGIHAEGVGIYIANNLIEDAPHQAVYVQGNDNVFERNFVRNVCIETDDCGAYYSGRNPSCRGNVIRGDLFMDIGQIDKHGCASVYFDDGQGGDTLNGNVFVRGSRGTFGAIFMNGGRDVQARSNVFLDCTVALAAVSWSEDQWEQSVAGEGEQSWLGWPALLTQEVDIRSPTYIEKYPSLIGFFRRNATPNHQLIAECNVVANCRAPFAGDWEFVREKNIVAPNAKDTFANLKTGDLSLRKDLSLSAPLSCYEPPALSGIGLQIDANRKSIDSKDRPMLMPRGQSEI